MYVFLGGCLQGDMGPVGIMGLPGPPGLKVSDASFLVPSPPGFDMDTIWMGYIFGNLRLFITRMSSSHGSARFDRRVVVIPQRECVNLSEHGDIHCLLSNHLLNVALLAREYLGTQGSQDWKVIRWSAYVFLSLLTCLQDYWRWHKLVFVTPERANR